jgi:hypothetical protein
MGWFSKIFKLSGLKDSEEHSHANYGGDPNGYEPTSSGDVWPESETEAIDQAIALSLLEESQRGSNVIDHDSQLEDDEQLAQALQQSLNVESPPQYGYGNIYQPAPVYFPMGLRICAGCCTEIGYGRYLNCLNAFWHPECFRCHACNLSISDCEFSTSGNYPYHKSCYKESYYPKCDVCKHFGTSVLGPEILPFS